MTERNRQQLGLATVIVVVGFVLAVALIAGFLGSRAKSRQG
jgi:hypothetical protein